MNLTRKENATMTKTIVNYVRELAPEELRQWRRYVVPRHELRPQPRGLIRIGLLLALVWIIWPAFVWPAHITLKSPITNGLINQLPQILVIETAAAVIGLLLLARRQPKLGIGGFAVTCAVLSIALGWTDLRGALGFAALATIMFVAMWIHALRGLDDDDDHDDDAPRPHPDDDGGGRISPDPHDGDHGVRSRPSTRPRGACHNQPGSMPERRRQHDRRPVRRCGVRCGTGLSRIQQVRDCSSAGD
jgi:hypothetical protein